MAQNWTRLFFDANSSTIEFSGGLQNAWGSSSASFLDTGPGVRYGWVEMPYVGGWGTSDGFTLATTTDRSAQYIDMQVLLKNKYEHAELFFGPDIRLLNQTLTMNGEIVGGTATVNLVEDLSTVYAGVTLGASFDVVSTDDWLVNILGAVSILGDSTQYDSTYVDILRTQTNSLTDSQIAVGALAKVTVQKQIAPTQRWVDMLLSTISHIHHRLNTAHHRETLPIQCCTLLARPCLVDLLG